MVSLTIIGAEQLAINPHLIYPQPFVPKARLPTAGLAPFRSQEMDVMKFGDCLAELMKERGWTRSELVRALGKEDVDSSLVYRWLRNERTPKLYSGDRERIAVCLKLSQSDFERLKQSQVESLEAPKNPSRPGAVYEAQRPPVGSCRERGRRAAVDPSPAVHPCHRLPAPGAIRGRDAVFETAIALIEAAPTPPAPGQREIQMTYQGHRTLDRFGDHMNWWLSALRAALQNGYDISHLVTIDGSEARSERMVEHVLRLTGTVGSYRPRFFWRYGSLRYPYEMVIVPEVGAMICLGTGHDGQVDSALLLEDPREVELLRAHFGALATETKPLTNAHSRPEDKFRYLNTLLQMEEREGEAFLAAGGLCSHTAPYSWFREGSNWVRRMPAWGAPDPSWMIELQKRRSDAFFRNVATYRHCTICPKSAIVRLAVEGKGGHHAPYTIVAREDRLSQLENVIALLRTFDRYELALLNESEERDHIVAGFLEVKRGSRGDDAVLLLEAYSPAGDGAVGGKVIEALEPTLCAAFRHYLADLFDHRISPPSRDKREVIQFLEAQIRRIREQLQED